MRGRGRQPGLSAAIAAGLVAGLPAAPALASGAASGQSDPSVCASGDGFPLTAPLVLNDRVLGEIDVRAGADGAAAVDAARMTALLSGELDRSLAAAVTALPETGCEFAPVEAFSVDTLTVRFDLNRLEVIASLPRSAGAVREASFRTRREYDPADYPPPEDFAAALGLRLAQDYVHQDPAGAEGFEPLRAEIDAMANFGGFDGVVARAALTYENDGGDRWDVRDWSFVKDDFERAVRYEFGEVRPRAQGFQSGQELIGVGVSRRYQTIRPFENIRPSGRRELILERDSTVEVLVGGVVVDTLRLSAGRYDLQDLPLTSGANDVTLVVDDETGRREVETFSLFVDPVLLERGVTDFGFAAGWTDYDDFQTTPAATGFVERGLAGGITVGANAQYFEERARVGGTVNIGTPFGLFGFSLAKGQDFDTGRNGEAAAIDYRSNLSLLEPEDFRFRANIVANTEDFVDVYSGPAVADSVQAAFDAQWIYDQVWTVGLAGSLSDQLGGPRRETARFSLSRRIGRVSARFNVTNTALDPGEDEVRALISVTASFGSRWSTAGRYDSDANTVEAEIRRNALERLGDLSGTLRVADSDVDTQVQGELDYFGNRLEAGLEHDFAQRFGTDGDTVETTRWRVATMIGYAGGSVGVGRYGDKGFFLVERHPSLSQSEIRLEDAGGFIESGRSDGLGPILIPVRREYTPEEQSIIVDPLPVGYDIGSGRARLLPGEMTGHHFMVGSDASRTVLGTMRNADGSAVSLAVGQLRPVRGGGEPIAFFTNRSGRFVAERVAAGEYVIVLDGQEVGRLDVPEDASGLVDAGEVVLDAR